MKGDNVKKLRGLMTKDFWLGTAIVGALIVVAAIGFTLAAEVDERDQQLAALKITADTWALTADTYRAEMIEIGEMLDAMSDEATARGVSLDIERSHKHMPNPVVKKAEDFLSKQRHEGTMLAMSSGEFYSAATRAGWPTELHQKLYRVVDCESDFKPGIDSNSSPVYHGLMQHKLGNGGVSHNALHDPVTNLRVGWNMYQNRGWQPWPTCKNK